MDRPLIEASADLFATLTAILLAQWLVRRAGRPPAVAGDGAG